MSQYDSDILQLAGKGYCCAQMLLQLALDMQGTENPGLIRAAQGLCTGGGDSNGNCGALTGGQCLLTYYLGKGSPQESASNRLPLLLSELRSWFTERTAPHGGTLCHNIAPTPDAYLSVCPGIIGDMAEKVFALLMAEGVELNELKEEL